MPNSPWWLAQTLRSRRSVVLSGSLEAVRCTRRPLARRDRSINGRFLKCLATKLLRRIDDTFRLNIPSGT